MTFRLENGRHSACQQFPNRFIKGMEPNTFPQISAVIESVTPLLATEWLKRMSPNRTVKESSVAMYATDMVNGNWMISPQGIAFDSEGTLFDGQHRLLAIIRCGLTIPMLILRGFPVSQGKVRTMDVVDCGIGRSLPDRIKLTGCFSWNPNMVAAIARQIALLEMGANSRATRRISLASTLEIIGFWATEITSVMKVIDRSKFMPARNASVGAAFTLACVTHPNHAHESLDTLITGRVDAGTPIYELRQSLIDGLDRAGRTVFCLSALLCHWHKLPGSQIYKATNKDIAAKFFREKQQDRFDKVSKLFFIKEEPASLAKHRSNKR